MAAQDAAAAAAAAAAYNAEAKAKARAKALDDAALAAAAALDNAAAVAAAVAAVTAEDVAKAAAAEYAPLPNMFELPSMMNDYSAEDRAAIDKAQHAYDISGQANMHARGDVQIAEDALAAAKAHDAVVEARGTTAYFAFLCRSNSRYRQRLARQSEGRH